MKIPRLLVIWILMASLSPLSLLSQGMHEKEKELAMVPADTAKANLLIALGKYYCNLNFEKALLYLQEALVLSSELNYRKGIAGSLLWQGRSFYYKDEYQLSFEYLERARKLFEEMNDEEGLANYYFAVGSINLINGSYLNATEEFQKVIDLSNITGDQAMKCLGYISLGNLNNKRSTPMQALPYLNKALAISEELENHGLTAVVLSNYGTTYELLSSYDSSLYFLEKGLQIRTALGEDRGMASSEFQVGKLMVKMGLYPEATGILQSSYNRFINLKDETGKCITAMKMAEAMDHAGEHSKALVKAEEALQIAKRIKNPNLISESYAGLARIMVNNGQYKEGYGYLNLHNQLRDSLLITNNERIIRELEMKFQTARKDDEIQLLKSKNEIKDKNNLLLSVSIIALLAILFLTLFLFRLKSVSMAHRQKIFENEKVIHEQLAEIQGKEQQLLKEQLESKNREIASKALEMLRVNETIGSIIEKLETLSQKNNNNDKISDYIHGIITNLEAQLKDNTWGEFEKIFKNIHSEFFQKLFAICPDLSPAEIKVAAFLKLNLSTKEIAAVTYKSEAGVKSSRFRLRKKLGLQSDDSLVPYLMQL